MRERAGQKAGCGAMSFRYLREKRLDVPGAACPGPGQGMGSSPVPARVLVYPAMGLCGLVRGLGWWGAGSGQRWALDHRLLHED